MLRKRGRPSRHWLRSLRKFTKADADLLVLKCVESILKRPDDVFYGRETVLVKVPFNLRRTTPSFPRGLKQDEDEYTITWKINANKLLDYLYRLGYVGYDSKALRASITSINQRLAHLEYLWENSVEWEVAEWLGGIVIKGESENGTD